MAAAILTCRIKTRLRALISVSLAIITSRAAWKSPNARSLRRCGFFKTPKKNMKKLKIIKKGTEKRYFFDTTNNLKGYVVEKYGDTFYITQSSVIFTYSGCVTCAIAVWVGDNCLLQTLIYINEGDIITKGAIVDERGIEQEVIKITKYL